MPWCRAVPRSDIGALAAFAALGWRTAAAERAATLGRLALYFLILAVFWGLWRATPLAELGRPELTPDRLFWYLVLTESIAIGTGYPYRSLEAEICSGDIAAGLARPVPYALATLAEWAGMTACRVLVLAAGGLVAGIWLTGAVPVPAPAFPALAVSLALAALIVLLCQLQLGYAACWFGSAGPFFWIWQKLSFVLGGLILPLTLYPPPWRGLAEASPFAAMLFAPGSLALGLSRPGIAMTLAGQLCWLAALALATWVVDRAAMARFADRGV